MENQSPKKYDTRIHSRDIDCKAVKSIKLRIMPTGGL
jgi:hypothetical protein